MNDYDLKYYTTRTESLGIFSSFSIFKLKPYKHIRHLMRPPFPILESNPSVKNVIANFNKSDVLLFFTLYGIVISTIIHSTQVTRILKEKYTVAKLLGMLGFTTSLMFAGSASYLRLIGSIDNGYRWKYNEQLLYDTTSEIDNNTIWGSLKVKI